MKTLTTFEALEKTKSMTETTWSYNHRHSSELWDITSEILTELSRRDKVKYRVKATEESVKEKLKTL